jgi:hypothetical protein
MAEYAKIETAMVIICDLCGSLYPDGYSQEKCGLGKCDWMEYLKETAADVAPVVHGRWAHLGGDEWCCSAYCEDCGARMDGDDDAKAD